MTEQFTDIVIVGAGAAGLATAIFAARELPGAGIVLLDGARVPGAKILVSGGGRCNVTNREVREADFNGGTRGAIARVLRAFPVEATTNFFAGLGVPLHEEVLGKLFPDSSRARSVLDALLGECRARGVRLLTSHRVSAIAAEKLGFTVQTACGLFRSRRVVLATGGRSLPKSGSDGAGYELAQGLGHTIVPTTPALVPLVLGDGPHTELQGVSQPVELTLSVPDRKPIRVAGSMLWTHFGASGPAVLDISRHWLRARLERLEPLLVANLFPGLDFPRVDRRLLEVGQDRPRLGTANALALHMPAAVAASVSRLARVDASRPVGQLTRDERRRLARLSTALHLPVVDSRGYRFAEVTAGGVALGEVDPRSMQSRLCPGLFLVGEILDVDGRLGGFNFQWAWASGRVAARGLAASVAGDKAAASV